MLRKEQGDSIICDVRDLTCNQKLQIEIIQILLSWGISPNCKNKYGNTLLHYTRDPQIVKYLLEHGADPNSKNEYGEETPLFGTRDPQKVNYLLEHGADPNIVSKNGRTLIDNFRYCAYGRQICIELLNHGFKPSLLTKDEFEWIGEQTV